MSQSCESQRILKLSSTSIAERVAATLGKLGSARWSRWLFGLARLVAGLIALVWILLRGLGDWVHNMEVLTRLQKALVDRPRTFLSREREGDVGPPSDYARRPYLLPHAAGEFGWGRAPIDSGQACVDLIS